MKKIKNRQSQKQFTGFYKKRVYNRWREER